MTKDTWYSGVVPPAPPKYFKTNERKLIDKCSELVELIAQQNEFLAQVVSQNSELISMLVNEDDEGEEETSDSLSLRKGKVGG